MLSAWSATASRTRADANIDSFLNIMRNLL
jgi:hypothetical protein